MNFQLTKQIRPILLFALTIALLGGVSYGGYRCWESRKRSQKPPVGEPGKPYIIGEQPNPPSEPITKPTDDPNWNLYTNREYGFSVEYPAGWKVREEIISRSGDPEYVARDKIFFKAQGGEYIDIFTHDTSKDLLEWAREFHELLHRNANEIPPDTNAYISGLPALIVYTPFGQAPADIITAFKSGRYVFTLEHATLKKENPLLWDTYEHFLRTFEFEGTENILDELPKFPIGF